jgi:hypothetical protein
MLHFVGARSQRRLQDTKNLNKTFSVYMYFPTPKIYIHWLMNLTSIFYLWESVHLHFVGARSQRRLQATRIWTKHFQCICIFEVLKSIYTDSWTLPPFFKCDKSVHFSFCCGKESGETPSSKSFIKNFSVYMYFINSYNQYTLTHEPYLHFLTVRKGSFYILLVQGFRGHTKVPKIWTKHFQCICIF